MPPPISAREVLELLARLGDVADRIVLVGGQAVNIWSEYYLAQGRAPELLADAPFTSKDIDFCGSHEAARLFAARVRQGRAKLATLDDATPNVGVVLYVDDGGHERVVDFLGAPFGMVGREVEQRSVRLDVLDEAGTSTGATYRVMHPVDCLESRVHNVMGLADAYDTPRGRRQLHASVVCAREALADILDTPASDQFDPVRIVLDLNERLFTFCLRDRHGRTVHQRTGIDPLDAVSVDPRLGERFIGVRLPQVRARVAALRAKLAGAPA